MQDLQHSGHRPGLGLAAERAELAVLIGQFWEALPGRPEETDGRLSDDRMRDDRRPTDGRLTSPGGCNVATERSSPG